MALTKDERKERAFLLSRFFKPATPINSLELFAGRRDQIESAVDAVNQEGQHVVLYGERGVGKTSLANMLFPSLQCPSHDVMTPMTSCTSQESFSSIWTAIFQEILFKADDLDQLVLSQKTSNLLADYTQQYADDITPDVIRRVLTDLGRQVILVVIIDEFDTVESAEARQATADMLKLFSDRNVPVTIVIIGVADDVEGLIEHHESTERCLQQVRMPRMRGREIKEIVTTCLGRANMSIETDAIGEIASISRGLPHYAHLLGLHSGRAALSAGSDIVTRDHVSHGIMSAVDNVQASITATYRHAISSSRKDAQYKQVLLACSLARTDEFGFFAPIDVRDPLSRIKEEECKIEGFARHLHAFCESDRGPVLRKEVPSKGRPRFRFTNPLIQPFVLLKGVSEGLINESDLKAKPNTQANDEDTWLFDDLW